MATTTMTIERVRAFNGLDVLVARDEGLFAAEGVDLRIVALPPAEMRSTADGTLTKPIGNQACSRRVGTPRSTRPESAAITAGWRTIASAHSRSAAGP